MAKVTMGETSERVLQQLETLQSLASSPGSIRARQFAEAVTAVQSALAEVDAVEEELKQQNEELLGVREALEIERHRYRDLFELAPDGYLLTDAQGVILEVNRAVARLLNTSQKALRGKPLPALVEQKERSRFRTLIFELRAGQRREDMEVRLLPLAGEPRTTLMTVARDADKPAAPPRLRWTLRDISERKATEQTLRDTEERLRHSQRLESIGRLAGGIAHSFNNLLAAIAFHTELLLDELEDPRLCHHAEEVRRAGERAAGLARQLLAFGRKQVLQPRALRLSSLILEMEPMLRRLVGEHIRFESRLDSEAPPVFADLGQLEQVVLNLVVNARDAMPDGGALLVSTGVRDLADGETGEALVPGSYTTLAITDTGTGMSPEILGRIFEPFFTTKERDKGTGLGLATVYGIVHQSGGAIRVQSEPGRGTTFTVFLPHAAQTEEIAAPVRRQETATAARSGEIVLLVEDEDNIREPAIEILESRGYAVLAASDAVEALALSQGHEGPIHLLVTDVIMPGMSGSQLAGQLGPVRPEMRVLYISGYPEDAIAHHGVLHPGQAFLQKPFPPSVLLTAVRKLLDEVGG